MTTDIEILSEMNYEFKRAGLVKLDWTKFMEEDVLITYHGKTDTLLNEVVLPRDAIMCTDVKFLMVQLFVLCLCDTVGAVVDHKVSRPYLYTDIIIISQGGKWSLYWS